MSIGYAIDLKQVQGQSFLQDSKLVPEMEYPNKTSVPTTIHVTKGVSLVVLRWLSIIKIDVIKMNVITISAKNASKLEIED